MTRDTDRLLGRVARLMAGQFQSEIALVRVMELQSTADKNSDEAAEITQIIQHLQTVHDAWEELAQALGYQA